jgi:hypothetical protein
VSTGPASAKAATHDSSIRTDFADNASSAVTASAEGRGGAGNPGRDTAARANTTRCVGEAEANEPTACRRRDDLPLRHQASARQDSGRPRKQEDLEGEPSPWETRAMRLRKRGCIATDSSVEKRLEVSCSTRTALKTLSGNGRCRRSHHPGAAAGSVVWPRSCGPPIRRTLQGRPRCTSSHDLRVAGRRCSGAKGIGLLVSLLRPFGDVGVRFGGSEHHLGSAPALRSRRHFGGRWRPYRPRSVAASGFFGSRPATSVVGMSGPLAPSSEVWRATSQPTLVGST